MLYVVCGNIIVMYVVLSFLIAIFFAFFVYGVYREMRGQKRVEELLEEIANVNERLRVMEHQKTEFISIASHQLRSPLTHIKGYASMILENTFGTINDEVRKAIETLYSSSERIVDLINELLTVSKLEEGRAALTFTTVNFVQFVQQVLDKMKDKVQASGLQLVFTIEEEARAVMVELDETKLAHVISHIFDNAVEFTTPPGEVRVAVSVDDVEKRIRIAISDTGIGMTSEQIKALFERFDLRVSVEGEIMARSEDKNSNSDNKQASPQEPSGRISSGIDIYVAKEIIHAHHGRFMAESDGVNMGTTFIIELPMVGVTVS